jgi:hypothetical protein
MGSLQYPVKGGGARDIPLPGAATQYLDRYVLQDLPTEVEDIKRDDSARAHDDRSVEPGCYAWRSSTASS